MSVIDLKDVPVGGGDPSTGLEGRSPSPASRGGLTGERIAAGPPAPRNDNIIDVPVHQQRSLATVTAEIRAYQDAARRMVVQYSIEIGRRLIEAKEMVKHGDWGSYLREELGFSQSTANNHMAMFRAYAADQMRLDGDNLKNQAFGNLTYTQALALLALPSEEEREAFVASHDLGSMSTRELREELRRRTEDPSSVTAEAVTPALEDARSVGKADATASKSSTVPRTVESPQGEGFGTGDADASTPVRADVGIGPYGEQDDKNGDAGRIAELTAQLAKANSRAIDAEEARDRIIRETEESREKLDAANAEREAARQKSQEAEAKAQNLAADLAAARQAMKKALDAKKKAEKELKDAKADRTVPAETLEQLRREAEEAARKALEAESGGQSLREAEHRYVQAEKEALEARQAEEAVHKQCVAIQSELEAAQKALKLAAPEVAAFRVRFEAAQEAINKAVDTLWALPSDKVDGGVRALRALLEGGGKRLEEERYEAVTPE